MVEVGLISANLTENNIILSLLDRRMTLPPDVLEWLSEQPSVICAIPLDGEQRRFVFSKEADVKTTVGIPLINESLEEATRRRFSIAVLTECSGRFPLKCASSILMRNSKGETVGYEVRSESERIKLESEKNVVWMSKDFAVELDADMSDLSFVLPAIPFPKMECALGVTGASVMFPSAGTIIAMSETFDEISGTEPVMIVSFDARFNPCADRDSARVPWILPPS